ncbi:uncharacterized protein JN550_002492 [Neoarthrinium moseri]|uniref:uncharacterized protein n=1 Tax=Neoarthrinium moseri TaxID=1658444 RepID=UPI001FDD94A5|nr:uncharacterized protein JN550_002492 [Neoarthrinium moseri]KAI1875063.1 hypothetical protein JN550_002492 [Neoarthrinium moseri]
MADGCAVQLTAPNGVTFPQPTGLFIGGQWVKSSLGKTITSIDPSTEKPIVAVQAGSVKDIDDAVSAARRALQDPSWRDLPETWDNGKPYSVSLNEDMGEVAGTLRYYAGFADKVFGQVIETTADKFAYTIREPIGVCGQIIPWNYPLAMAAWKLGPALACGNTVVLKPAEQTPLSILYFANLVTQAGFPPGVVNIVNGFGAEAGKALASHEDVDKIAFTGSTATAKDIMRMAASNLKNITLETGGKSPLVVFDDAELENAVEWAHAGIMSNQGQICTATSRILVQAGIFDQFMEAFKKQVRNVSTVGDPFDSNTFQGPQVSKAQLDRIKDFISVGKAEGANLEMGGQPQATAGGKGYFIQPTVFTGVNPQMRIFQEEVFGPFVTISKFESEEEAVALCNGTQYGLGSAVFTTNLTKAHRVARRIEAGMVWINSSNDSDWRIPFGGVKQSGIGRELGEAGLEAYSTVKAIHVNMRSKL